MPNAVPHAVSATLKQEFKNLVPSAPSTPTTPPSINTLNNWYKTPVKNLTNIVKYAKYYHATHLDKLDNINTNILYIFLTSLKYKTCYTPVIKIGYASNLPKRHKDLESKFDCTMLLLSHFKCEGEFREKQLHLALNINFPKLSIKFKKNEKNLEECYLLNDNIMKQTYNILIKDIQYQEQLTKQQVEKTKQTEFIETTKQTECSEKTKQEVEKTKQTELIETTKQEVEKTKQTELIETTKQEVEKTKQTELIETTKQEVEKTKQEVEKTKQTEILATQEIEKTKLVETTKQLKLNIFDKLLDKNVDNNLLVKLLDF
ncbi:hypothetical protein crov193 [Cafeteria roenbergensis virus]|uniref:Uncharacterized protein n=1 Tax=Cafeteria roenbergensis virus (strain BV-PW1) TaxID=693272 RepID=E3T4W3_CROVB|nr:hypothetical protein crov193 [Cafeteria roenbergensis virus BV-PW1]ADO67226.1 hypothetical protein crov193 [Cafeteria roenbergensis virus BV-PW1]